MARAYPFEDVEATREQVLLRAGFCGLPGSGKTHTTLRLGHRMVERMHLGPMFVIDTEHGSAMLYAYCARTGHGYSFRHVPLKGDFSPATYIAAIERCEAQGAGVIVIDSLSHAWNGMNGILEMVDQRTEAGRGRGGAPSGWNEMSRVHVRFIERIMQSSAHVLFTVRMKTGWSVDRDRLGRLDARRLGIGPVQRDGLEYEPDLFCTLTADRTLSITKSRAFDCPDLATGSTFEQPDVEFADIVIDWLQQGTPRVDELAAQVDAAVVASKDRASYDEARDALIQWMTARSIPKAQGTAALTKLSQRVRSASRRAVS